LLKTVKGFCCLMQEIKNGIDRTHHKYNPFIMQNIRANTLIIGANNNPINKKVRLNADFSINYKKTALLFAHL